MPTQYDLPYEDLTLVTRDHVKIRCYLLTQRKELNLATKTTFESLQEADDPPEKVGIALHLHSSGSSRITNTVCRHSTDGDYVSWEWREYGA